MVTLIGMGSGSWEALSAQAQDAVRRAGLVFGAKRLLAGLPPDRIETVLLLTATSSTVR